MLQFTELTKTNYQEKMKNIEENNKIFTEKITQSNYKDKINKLLKIYNIKDNIDDIYNYINSNHIGKLENNLSLMNNNKFNYLGKTHKIINNKKIGEGSFNKVYIGEIVPPIGKNDNYINKIIIR